MSFSLNQIVRLSTSEGRYYWPARVKKVWKSGVFTVDRIGRDGSFEPINATFHTSGRQRGEYGSYRVRALENGETPESIYAMVDAAEAAKNAENEAKAARQKEDVAKWWAEFGKSFWEQRKIVGHFNNVEISLVSVSYDNEDRTMLVNVSNDDNFLGQTHFRCGYAGMYKTISEKSSVSSFSGSATGTYLEEVLYFAFKRCGLPKFYQSAL